MCRARAQFKAFRFASLKFALLGYRARITSAPVFLQPLRATRATPDECVRGYIVLTGHMVDSLIDKEVYESMAPPCSYPTRFPPVQIL